MKISTLMVSDPITITENASIQEAIELMKINSIRHLPVVSKDNQLTGFITLADLKQGLIPSMLGEVSLRDLIILNPIVVRPDDDNFRHPGPIRFTGGSEEDRPITLVLNALD